MDLGRWTSDGGPRTRTSDLRLQASDLRKCGTAGEGRCRERSAYILRFAQNDNGFVQDDSTAGRLDAGFLFAVCTRRIISQTDPMKRNGEE